MRTRPRPNPRGLGRPRGPRSPISQHTAGCRLARLIGFVALVVVASSCLPVGKASTSTITSVTAEDGLADDPGTTAAIVGAAATTTRRTFSASGTGVEPIRVDLESYRDSLGNLRADPSAIGRPATTPASLTAPERVWVVADDEQAATFAARGNQIGETVIVATGDLRALPPQTRETIFSATEVELGPGLGEDAVWQLEVIRRGDQIPGGGLLMFDSGIDRRLVAMYGHPASSSLGVLGEQGHDEGVERLRSIAQGYDADGSVILPTFEIITTVASASAGSDGDYSAMTARDVIRPWIETATANDMYVVLDLQPGRSDFLTQAKVYEEFLQLPNVGLALDPEWRLKPHQVHLEQIGTVDAAEINQVVEWLAGVVREHALPQKLLIVHQFRYSMITNRSAIETPPELAVLIHMDGQGSMQAKYNTWNALTTMADTNQFHWGWKNFYDEDSPMATPEQVLELTPNSVFVSFQ